MPLSRQKSPTLDKAVNSGVDAGPHFAVSTGNENEEVHVDLYRIVNITDSVDFAQMQHLPATA